MSFPEKEWKQNVKNVYKLKLALNIKKNYSVSKWLHFYNNLLLFETLNIIITLIKYLRIIK